MCRDERFVMAHQQHQLSLLQRLLPGAKRVPGGIKGRVSMTLQDGATTSDILTGILQASWVSMPLLHAEFQFVFLQFGHAAALLVTTAKVSMIH